ncbi:MAG TPA: cysteine methyltransferase, partial [Alcanivorax sp.]|nr:cysteine methyltransferase [Alcanivorax sp.]
LPLAGTPSGETQIQRLSDEGVTILGARVPKSCFWRP